MNFIAEWRALSTRIRAFTEAATLYARFQQSSTADSYGGANYLGDQSQKILRSIIEFVGTYKQSLPPIALKTLEDFLSGRPGQVISDQQSSREIRAGAIFLAGLESELSHLLFDHQELVHTRSERAFSHLQRSLVVDPDMRAKWTAAFNKGETHCEALGSVHLLSHGIYAFKVDAKGARTDLVFNEPTDSLINPRALEGIVLTEWKVADETTAAKRFTEARAQAELYQQGALAGIELTRYRYLVVVSISDLRPTLIPGDLEVGGVIYRHINVAIESAPPSKRSKKP